LRDIVWGRQKPINLAHLAGAAFWQMRHSLQQLHPRFSAFDVKAAAWAMRKLLG
jgi:hypothetical protein